MKKILFMTTLTFSLNIFAVTVIDFCQSFNFKDQQIECLNTAYGHYVNQSALDICLSLTWKKNKMPCLITMLDRIYTDDQISNCREETFDHNKINCLDNKFPN